jgi:hypothetical protein
MYIIYINTLLTLEMNTKFSCINYPKFNISDMVQDLKLHLILLSKYVQLSIQHTFSNM